MDKFFRVNEKVNGYYIQKMLGEGRFGIAYLAINDRSEQCVVKQLKREMLSQSRQKLFYEEQILRRLDDHRFPKFISKFEDNYREGYLLEYIDGQVFNDLLVKNRNQFTRRDIYAVASQLLDMADFLHTHNIIHRDIRLPNVILTKNKELALIDFGLARFIDNERNSKQIDYWFIGDFLIFLYYSTYKNNNRTDRPWFRELDLNYEEIKFLKKLMGIGGHYRNSEEIKIQLDKIKRML